MKDLRQYRIAALDGDIGHVTDFYFDDDAWVIRYLVVETGNWFWNRRVLIPPIAIDRPNWKSRVLPVSITRAQVRESPDIETHLPVSRQHGMQYLGSYGYPHDRAGGGPWDGRRSPHAPASGDGGATPNAERRVASHFRHAAIVRAIHRHDDPHLRSCKAVIGYHVHATDGDIGHIDGLLVDEETWAIRYFVVDTRRWRVGHKVLISSDWLAGFDWTLQTASVRVDRASIRHAPAYDAGTPSTRDEEALHRKHTA